MARERWRNVENHPNYRISSEGRVKNKVTGKVLKGKIDTYGYPQVVLCENGVKQPALIHRLVAKAFVDGYDDDLQVNHIDGDKRNNNVENLEWVTRSENVCHAYSHGLMRRSDKAGCRPKSVRVIETGEVFVSESECARVLGVKREGINACLNGRQLSHHGLHYEYA